MRPPEDLTPLFPYARRGGGDRLGREVVKAERRGDAFELGHHAADRWATGRKELVSPGRPHVDGLRFRPAEQICVEGESGLPLAGVQLVPARHAEDVWCGPLGRL